ncbi:GYDIA family GHMP kinase [Croceivirga radicis]|uniref:GYDIA family GHMP kinase n=1 Tax=Croceivirga radicis TaxID=1929488 RepID=UPI000255B2F7|nr:GYDIA family GHMP kinase [Croceivirga radicis]
MTNTFYSNGKLLLTGEYAILDGATGLAIPTKFGQWLYADQTAKPCLNWISKDADGSVWFHAEFSLPALEIKETNDIEKAKVLKKIFKAVRIQKPDFLDHSGSGWQIETKLSFPRNWGLGTSSTLLNNIAQWSQVDAFELLGQTLGGSGYDLACAQHMQPILYKLDLGKPQILPVRFNPNFSDKLFFIYLNKKQNSRDAIATYRKQIFNKADLIAQINRISHALLETESIELFESLVIEHEMAIGTILGQSPVQNKFPDYFGALKSLGAWGGDFILATGNEKTPDYFKAKGFDTVVPFTDMIL